MTAERFSELLKITGNIAPEGLEQYIGDLSTDEKELLPRARLQYVLDLNHVPCDKQDRLLDALDEANAIPELVELSHIMAQDAVRALNRCTACEFVQPKPACLTGFSRDAFGFLFSQLLVLEGRKQLRARSIPEKYDLDIPERMTRRALGKYVETGDINFDEYDLLVLPGGVKGTNNLNACEELKKQLVRFNDQGKGIAAICAAPTVFAGLGLLDGKASTCNPGFWEELRANGAKVIEDSKVVVNGNIITSQAMGTSVDFGLELVGYLCGEDAKEALRKNIRFGAI